MPNPFPLRPCLPPSLFSLCLVQSRFHWRTIKVSDRGIMLSQRVMESGAGAVSCVDIIYWFCAWLYASSAPLPHVYVRDDAGDTAAFKGSEGFPCSSNITRGLTESKNFVISQSWLIQIMGLAPLQWQQTGGGWSWWRRGMRSTQFLPCDWSLPLD